MSIRDIENLPNLPEHEPGIPHTNITNAHARALNAHRQAIIIGPVEEPPLGGSSASLKYVEASADWTSGNTISGEQVTSQDDNTPTGTGTVQIDILSPNDGSVNPVNVAVSTGDIIAYMEYEDQDGASKGLAVNLKMGVNNSLGNAKYQVFQMTTTTTAGWDWVRAHG